MYFGYNLIGRFIKTDSFEFYWTGFDHLSLLKKESKNRISDGLTSEIYKTFEKISRTNSLRKGKLHPVSPHPLSCCSCFCLQFQKQKYHTGKKKYQCVSKKEKNCECHSSDTYSVGCLGLCLAFAIWKH